MATWKTVNTIYTLKPRTRGNSESDYIAQPIEVVIDRDKVTQRICSRVRMNDGSINTCYLVTLIFEGDTPPKIVSKADADSIFA